ncbi:MAG: ATP-binding cassette domain-containing protein [Desulfarculales bacterium]|jgi:zinc transport system ATP-binding protein|nr:ATP-binding cassette domain-containing protein [Desulfarculales bacterium]
MLACQDASFACQGVTVAAGLNFSVAPGEWLCVVGENGSGKTTLLQGLLRLKPPHGGRVISSLKAEEIGYLPQQTVVSRDFPASVYEVALSGRLNSLGLRPFYARRDKAAAEMNLERLGILDLKNKCYRELSGGQQQRVLLARALCAARKLLVLDEPATGLDPLATLQLYRLLAEIKRENGLTVVMVSHDIPNALKYADLILHLQGRQIFFGPAAAYRDSPAGRSFIERGPVSVL